MKAKMSQFSNFSQRQIFLVLILLISVVGLAFVYKKDMGEWGKPKMHKYSTEGTLVREYENPIALPAAKNYGGKGLYQAIQTRRSVREYSDKSLTLDQISQLLWSAQGITNKDTGFRSAPSAKSSYPIEMYLVAKNVTGLEQGVYHYSPSENSLSRLKINFDIDAFYKAANEQASIKGAPAVFVMSAVMGRTQARFPDSSAESVAREVYQESGHIAQNMYLAAVDLDLGMVVVGGYDPDHLPQSVGLTKIEEPVYLIPVGHKK